MVTLYPKRVTKIRRRLSHSAPALTTNRRGFRDDLESSPVQTLFITRGARLLRETVVNPLPSLDLRNVNDRAQISRRVARDVRQKSRARALC